MELVLVPVPATAADVDAAAVDFYVDDVDDVAVAAVAAAADRHNDSNGEMHAARDDNYRSQVTKTPFVAAPDPAAATEEEEEEEVFDENGIVDEDGIVAVAVAAAVEEDVEEGMVFD